MLLDVPFIPDDRYTDFLRERERSIHSVHFSLDQADIPDGRHKTEVWDIAELSRSLSGLGSVKKYALLNSRFHAPDTYLNREKTSHILGLLETLLDEQNIDGITFVDFYLLQALSDAAPETVGRLEAVPGINCMFDSFARIRAGLDLITRTNFRLPGKINLDRSLNRQLQGLKKLAANCREHYPGIRLTLLANEGCLFSCPFKLTHDSQIAYANTQTCANLNYEINRDFGCIRVLSDFPEAILHSPFIRPEDQDQYADCADVLKICGRTLGPEFLMKTVTAYLRGEYEGNLLALLDTQDWQVDRLVIDNRALPPDFFERLTSCDNDCVECGYCKAVFEKAGRFQPLNLKDFRTPEPSE